jgi:hypothetical protein
VLAYGRMATGSYQLDPADPRAPSVEQWAAMSDAERQQAVDALPSELPRETLPEGDEHRNPEEKALEALREYYRRLGRNVYLSAELPVYYPAERCSTSIRIPGSAGSSSTKARGSTSHSRSRSLASRVLGLDLALELGRVRFFAGSAPLPHADELTARLDTMLRELVVKEQDLAQALEQAQAEAESEKARAEQQQARAERLAARLPRPARQAMAEGLACRAGTAHAPALPARPGLSRPRPDTTYQRPSPQP